MLSGQQMVVTKKKTEYNIIGGILCAKKKYKKIKTKIKKERKKKKLEELYSIVVVFHKQTCFITDFIRNLNDMSMKINSGSDCVDSIRSSFQRIYNIWALSFLSLFRKFDFINLHPILYYVSINQSFNA